VQLIEALGGGWDRSQLPTLEQVTRKPPKADTDSAVGNIRKGGKRLRHRSAKASLIAVSRF
jgi:hypothetical protein